MDKDGSPHGTRDGGDDSSLDGRGLSVRVDVCTTRVVMDPGNEDARGSGRGRGEDHIRMEDVSKGPQE